MVRFGYRVQLLVFVILLILNLINQERLNEIKY